MNAIDATTMTGAAGEHLVMSRLLSRGYIAALAPQGVPNFDIVVTSVEGTQLCAFQVKTRWDKGSDGGWHMRQKHESLRNPRIFYCFVDLGKTASASASVHVIPSATVADVVQISHATWLSKPGARGQKRNDSSIRRLLPDYERLMGPETPYRLGWLDRYLENWDQVAAIAQPAPAIEK
ncbi:hypothetical protein [Paracoccus laeviglucosivorans]|uniref:PD(D/E)XK endonuclease domain-containing protein n=1 Tax=Paracoccus laeviglucosivorans TaxID=1197861 RepID=A0A521ACF4_9RHOB|nr:hypothetical protein [Paracoccus laeviglucosivorans]SMO32513.1 hypothetical protein SAMN06265221_10143 [Paracoccus laeviglucosivorans]